MGYAGAGRLLNPMRSQFPLTMWVNHKVTLPKSKVEGERLYLACKLQFIIKGRQEPGVRN